jgi:hypothetical protein
MRPSPTPLLVSLLLLTAGHVSAQALAPAERSTRTTSTTAAPNGLSTTSTATNEGKTTTTTSTVDGGGLRVDQTTTEVVAVQEPPSSATQSGFAIAGLFGAGDDVTITGLAFDAHLRVLSGEQLPGTKGGGWLGFFFEPSVGVNVTNVETTTPRVCFRNACSGGETKETTSGAATAAATAGLQYMSFSEMDAESREQSGFGVAVGARLTAFVPFEEGDTTTSLGPAFSLLSTSYNPGTARLETSNFNLLILPTDALTLVMIGYSSNVD